MASYHTILYETEKGRARITLNRPEKLNALSGQLHREIHAALWEADDDPAVHVIIIRGSGRAFSAGYDLSTDGADTSDAYGSSHRARRTLDDDIWRLERQQAQRMAIWDMHKPVIAQVHGYCLAGGTDLALVCDLVVAADDAVIGYPPVRAQGSPPAHMWTYLVGPQWAKRLLLTGDSISGADAARIGLIYQSVPAEELTTAVESLADRLALVDNDVLAANKRAVNLAMELMGARTMQRLAAELDARGHQAPSAREFNKIAAEKGLKAALQWRDADFGSGRVSVDHPSAGRDAAWYGAGG